MNPQTQQPSWLGYSYSLCGRCRSRVHAVHLQPPQPQLLNILLPSFFLFSLCFNILCKSWLIKKRTVPCWIHTHVSMATSCGGLILKVPGCLDTRGHASFFWNSHSDPQKREETFICSTNTPSIDLVHLFTMQHFTPGMSADITGFHDD